MVINWNFKKRFPNYFQVHYYYPTVLNCREKGHLAIFENFALLYHLIMTPT